MISIGDEVRDIDAATSQGIDSGAVTWGYANEDALRARAPNVIFTSINALVEHLCGVESVS